MFEKLRKRNVKTQQIGATALAGDQHPATPESAEDQNLKAAIEQINLKTRELPEARILFGKRAGRPDLARLYPTNGYPLVERQAPVTGQKEILSHLIFVGDSVMAVSSVVDSRHTPHKVTETAIRLLPIGKQSNAPHTGQLSSRTLLSIDPDIARAPREDGIIKSWEETTVGRTDLSRHYGVDDDLLSGTHLKMTLDANGSVDIVDQDSKNSTVVISMQDLGVKTEALHPDLSVITDYLSANPVSWSREFADQQVVVAQ